MNDEKKINIHDDVDVHALSRTKELLYHHLEDDANSHSLGKIYLDLGTIYQRIRNYPLAHDAWEKASGCFADPEAPLELATAYYQQGLLFLEERKADLALDKWYQALAVLPDEWAGGSLLKCQVILEIGKCLCDVGRFEEAQDFFEDGIKRAQRAGHYSEEALTMRELAQVFFRQGNLSQARTFCQSTLHKWKILRDKLHIGQIVNDLGYIYQELKEYQRAIAAFKYSLTIQRQYNDPVRFETLLQLGKLYLRHDPEITKEYCQEAVSQLLESLSYRFNEAQEKKLGQVFYLLANYCKEKNDRKNLLMFCRQSLQIYKKYRMEAQWNEVYQLYSKFASDQVQHYNDAWDLINKLPQHEKLRLHKVTG